MDFVVNQNQDVARLGSCRDVSDSLRLAITKGNCEPVTSADENYGYFDFVLCNFIFSYLNDK